ncbi:MAG: hypothetical protein Q8T13_23660 [Acidobacteriota bacterium]|nr:hypothetical protein [Acidobacteriota bacterium]
MADARVSMAAIMRAFGVPAVVTRPTPADTTPIETTVTWVNASTDGNPVGFDLSRSEHMKLMVLRRDKVPTVPKGTLVSAPEQAGEAAKLWKVDSTIGIEFDQTRVLVVEA